MKTNATLTANDRSSKSDLGRDARRERESAPRAVMPGARDNGHQDHEGYNLPFTD